MKLLAILGLSTALLISDVAEAGVPYPRLVSPVALAEAGPVLVRNQDIRQRKLTESQKAAARAKAKQARKLKGESNMGPSPSFDREQLKDINEAAEATDRFAGQIQSLRQRQNAARSRLTRSRVQKTAKRLSKGLSNVTEAQRTQLEKEIKELDVLIELDLSAVASREREINAVKKDYVAIQREIGDAYGIGIANGMLPGARFEGVDADTEGRANTCAQPLDKGTCSAHAMAMAARNAASRRKGKVSPDIAKRLVEISEVNQQGVGESEMDYLVRIAKTAGFKDAYARQLARTDPKDAVKLFRTMLGKGRPLVVGINYAAPSERNNFGDPELIQDTNILHSVTLLKIEDNNRETRIHLLDPAGGIHYSVTADNFMKHFSGSVMDIGDQNRS